MSNLTNQEFLGLQTESTLAVEGEPVPAGGPPRRRPRH